jgi:O-methyltransferase involved in polyketide biosynthesis
LERLGRAGDVTFVGVDLTVDDVGAELADAGQDDCATTLFIAEGLLVYLPEAVARGSLQSLHRRAARGSRLVATLAVHPDGVDSAQAVAAANARRRNPWAEPWRTILTREAHLALLADSGWAATRVVEAPSASGRGVTLLVDAAATPT